MTTTDPTLGQLEVPASGRYRLDPDRCEITFHTRHLFGLAAVNGTMRVTTGEILHDQQVTSSSLTVSISSGDQPGAGHFFGTEDRRDRRGRGLQPDPIDISEFHAADGGLTCMSMIIGVGP